MGPIEPLSPTHPTCGALRDLATYLEACLCELSQVTSGELNSLIKEHKDKRTFSDYWGVHSARKVRNRIVHWKPEARPLSLPEVERAKAIFAVALREVLPRCSQQLRDVIGGDLAPDKTQSTLGRASVQSPSQQSVTDRGIAAPELTLQIDDAFVKEWHPRYDETECDEGEYTRLVATVAREMQSMGTISKKTFLDIWNWKGAMRVIGLTTIYVAGQRTKAVTAEEDEYETRYATAFRRAASEPPERKLEALLGPGVKLPGVGAPTGSTLIHFIHPATMPIIDRRTAGILFKCGRIATAECWLETYEEFRKAINRISRDCPGWTLRQIDRALFAYHKQVLDAGGKQPIDGGPRAKNLFRLTVGGKLVGEYGWDGAEDRAQCLHAAGAIDIEIFGTALESWKKYKGIWAEGVGAGPRSWPWSKPIERRIPLLKVRGIELLKSIK